MSEQDRTDAGSTASIRPQEDATETTGAGRQVMEVANEEIRSVAGDTKVQARRLLGTVADELRSQTAAQQSRAAAGLRSAGTDLAAMASGTERPGFASQVVSEAADRVEAVGRWLGDRDPKAVLVEVKGFARRRPGVFIAIAVGAGIVVGRLARALASSGEGSTGSTSDAKRAAPGISGDASSSSEARFSAPPVPPVPEAAPPRTRTVGAPGTDASAATYGGV